MPIVFRGEKFSLRVLLSICLIVCQFQPGVAYKSVTDKKKKRVVKRIAEKLPLCYGKIHPQKSNFLFFL